jgi:hypothetical protein
MNTTEPTNHTNKLHARLSRDIEQLEAVIHFINTHYATFTVLNLPVSSYTNYIDFDNLERPDVLRVIKAFPGRWEKTNSFDAKLNYTRANELDEEVTLRCWGAEAPDCCTIEETVEYVEVPARTERRVTRTLKCPDPSAPATDIADAV